MSDAQDWPDPTPLQAPRTPATFPVDALPAWAEAYVNELAEATQTPLDLPGVCVLGVLAACAGGRVLVEPRRGWREPVNLYTLAVMPPGSRKSAVVAAVGQPLFTAERLMDERARGDIAEQMMMRDIAEKAAERAMQAAARAEGEERDRLTSDAISASKQAEAIAVPTLPRLLADDVTPEAVASLLADHGGRMAILSAEGGIFDTMAGRYSKTGVPNLDVWLKGHSGDSLRVDRKGRAAEYIRSPALTMLLTVQPSVLSGIARNGEFRGRGLLARFLYTLPPDNVGHRKIGAEPVSDAVTDNYSAHVLKLVEDLSGWTDPAVLLMTPEAHELLLGVEATVEPRLSREGEYGSMREWASKMVGAIVRIAGLIHVATATEAFRTPISKETLSSAIRLGGYFAEHAKAAFGLLGDSDAGNARYVLEFLHRRDLDGFSIRDLTTDLPRGRFPTADDVTAAVDVLVEHGWVIPVPPPEHKGPGRKPSPRFLTHPAVKDYESDEVAAQSAQSAEPPAERHSADSADIAGTS